MLNDIVQGRYPAAREDALRRYVAERERRRRHAAVRDARDAERRTLVGAHVSKAEAEEVARRAAQEGQSVTRYVREVIRQAMEHTDTTRKKG